jgi:hypothetical protein
VWRPLRRDTRRGGLGRRRSYRARALTAGSRLRQQIVRGPPRATPREVAGGPADASSPPPDPGMVTRRFACCSASSSRGAVRPVGPPSCWTSRKPQTTGVARSWGLRRLSRRRHCRTHAERKPRVPGNEVGHTVPSQPRPNSARGSSNPDERFEAGSARRPCQSQTPPARLVPDTGLR